MTNGPGDVYALLSVLNVFPTRVHTQPMRVSSRDSLDMVYVEYLDLTRRGPIIVKNANVCVFNLQSKENFTIKLIH